MVDLPFAAGVERSRLHAGLLVGDVAIVALLLAAGMVRHNEDPLALPGRTLLVVGPFVVSWLAVACGLGAYTGVARRSAPDAAVNAAGVWLVAVLVAAGLRATPYLPGNSPPTFVAVVVALGAPALAVWRVAVTVLAGSGAR